MASGKSKKLQSSSFFVVAQYPEEYMEDYQNHKRFIYKCTNSNISYMIDYNYQYFSWKIYGSLAHKYLIIICAIN